MAAKKKKAKYSASPSRAELSRTRNQTTRLSRAEAGMLRVFERGGKVRRGYTNLKGGITRAGKRTKSPRQGASYGH